jgi:DNA-binding IclR family transcriptional regulator
MPVPLGETPRKPRAASTTAARVADVLLAFAEDRELGISAVARSTGVGKATCFRVARALVSRGLLEQNGSSRKYSLGPAALALGGAAVRRTELVASALPVLQSMRDESSETATLSILVGTKRMYLDQIVSPREVAMTVQVGRLYPLHAGASSKAILAHASPPLREAVLGESLAALTPLTMADRRALEADLETTRVRGYAISLGERQEGAASVAAPILGVHGFAIGSLSICGPVERFDPNTAQRLAQLVRESAVALSTKLGAAAPGPRATGSQTQVVRGGRDADAP